MARRRINLTFVYWAIGVVAALGAMGALASFMFFRDSPLRYIQMGDRAMVDGKYDIAHFNYAKALSLDKKNADVWLKDGIAIRNMAREDPQLQPQALRQWNTALTIDPTNTKVLQQLLATSIEQVEYNPRPSAEIFQNLHDTAERIVQINPTDLKAAAYVHIAPIAAWIHGIEQPESRIEAEMNALMVLMRKDPENPDVPYYLARAYINRAEDQFRQNLAANARDLFQQAVAIFDTAVKAAPKNAVMYFRYYWILTSGDRLDPNPDAAGGSKYLLRMRDVLERARVLIDKADPLYVDIFLYSAMFEASPRLREMDKAEKILRQVAAAFPENQRVRLALANLLRANPAKREEAIQILRAPVSRDPNAIGMVPGQKLSSYETSTLLELDNLLIDQYVTIPDPAKRQQVLAEIQDVYQRLWNKAGMTPATLKLKGKIQLLDGGIDAAIRSIQTFEQCLQVLHQNDPQAKDYDLMYLLARAYYVSKQTGQAKTYLWKIVDGNRGFYPARIMLTELLLNDHELDLAHDQLVELDKLMPNEPDVHRLWLAYLSQLADSPARDRAVQERLDKLPESTAAERFNKGQLALSLGDRKTAIRLIEGLLAERPGDMQIISTLVQVYRLTEKDKAIKIVQDALDKDKTNNELQLMLADLKGANAEEKAAISKGAIDKITDPCTREVRLFELELSLNHQKEALAHLDAAEKINPDNPVVMDLRFQLALNRQDFETAGVYARRLGDKNVDQAHGLIYQFRLEMAKGNISRAIEIGQNLARSLPEFSRSWLSLGQAHQAAALFEQAISDFTMAIQKQSENVDATRGIIECYYSLNKPEDARRYIQQGLLHNPNNKYFIEKMIEWNLNYGKPTDAVDARKKALDARKDLVENWVNLGVAYLRLAQFETQRNNINAANLALKNAQDVFLEAKRQWPDERIIYAHLADLAIMANGYETGEKTLLELSVRPSQKDRSEALIMLVDYYTHFNRLDKAEAALKEAMQRSHNAPEVQQRMGTFYTAQGRYTDALKILDPRSPDPRVRQQYVETLIGAGEYVKAESALLQEMAAPATTGPSQAAPSRNPQLLSLLGFIYLNSGRPQQALAKLDEALAIDGHNPTALYYRGFINLRRVPPDPDGAIKDLQAARDENPRNASVRMALAEAFRLKGKEDDAVRELEATLAITPLNKDVRLRLAEIYTQIKPQRWSDAQRLLQEIQSLPQYQRDPDWPRAEAQLYMKRSDTEKAMAAMLRAMNLQPNNALLIQEYMQILLKGKKYRDLLDLCNKYAELAQQQKAAWVYRMRAVANKNLDMKDPAMADFELAFTLAQESKNEEEVVAVVDAIRETIGIDEALRRVDHLVQQDNRWRVIAAYMRASKGDYLTAIGLIEKVLNESARLQPLERQTALSVAGSVYMTAGEFDKSQQAYRKLLEMSPDDITAQNNLACILVEGVSPPRPEEAHHWSEKAFNLMQSRGLADASVYDTHGWVMVECGHLEDGIMLLQKALDRKPLLEAYYHLGEAYLRYHAAGYAGQALRNFQLAKQVIQQRKAGHQLVDPKVEGRIEQDIAQAQDLLTKEQGGAGQGSIGPRPAQVP